VLGESMEDAANDNPPAPGSSSTLSYLSYGYDGIWRKRTLPGIPRPRTRRDAPPDVPSSHDLGYKLNRLLDINGDGIPEILMVFWNPGSRDPGWAVFRRQSLQADTLSQIKDSFERKTTVDYLPMSDRTVHTPGAIGTPGCQYPLSCDVAGRWLVRSVKRDTGVLNEATSSQEVTTETHSYTAARSDRSGNGWLGFETHKIDESFRARSTTSYFDNSSSILIGRAEDQNQRRFFPYLGNPVRVEVETRNPLAPFPLLGEIVESTAEYRNIGTAQDKDAGKVYYRPDRTCENRYMLKALQPRSQYASVCTTYPEYDPKGFLQKSIRTTGNETRTLVTQHDNGSSKTPPLYGIVTSTSESSEVGDLTRIRLTTIEPDEFGLPWKTHELRALDGILNRDTEFERTPFGEIKHITVTGESSAIHPVTHNRPAGLQVQTRETFITYDESAATGGYGYKNWSKDPEGNTETFTYDPVWGKLIAHEDAKRVLTKSVYDGFGRPIETSSYRASDPSTPISGTTTISYLTPLALGLTPPLVVSTNRTQGGVHLESQDVSYNQLGQEIETATTMPRGQVSRIFTKYDVAGRAVAVSEPVFSNDGSAQYDKRTYDGRDRLIEKIEVDGITKSASIVYDGLTATITNGRGRRQKLVQDPGGLLLISETLGPAGNEEVKGSVIYVYGPFGLPITSIVQIGTGATTLSSFSYDNYGNRTFASDPRREQRLGGFNSFGEQVYDSRAALADGSERTETRTYDRLGRVLTQSNADGVTTLVHGPAGLTRATSPTNTVLDRHYDDVGRIKLEQLTIPQLANDPDVARRVLEVETLYDGFGRVSGLRYPRHGSTGNRFELAYRYSSSAGSTLMGVDQVVGGATPNRMLWQAEDYTARGQLERECFGNKFRAIRGFYGDGLLSGITGDFLGETESCTGEGDALTYFPEQLGYPQRQFYEYDGAQNLLRKTDSGMGPNRSAPIYVTEEYTYDDLNRFDTWKVITTPFQRNYTINYDPSLGNITGRTADDGQHNWSLSYGDPQRPYAVTTADLGTGTRSFSYDERGRRKTDSGRTIIYNSFDLPKSITRQTPAESFEFDYDAFGQRTRKTGGGWNSYTFGDLYERRAPVGSDSAARNIYRVMAAGRIVAEVELGSDGAQLDKRYLHAERLGSPDLITTDGPDHNVVYKNRFEPFGNSVSWSDPTVPASETLSGGTLRGFTGHEHDVDLGYVNMGGRIYDPGSLSFLTTDPVIPKPMWAHAFHPYSYVVNNPVNATDPTGFIPSFSSGDATTVSTSVDDPSAGDGYVPIDMTAFDNDPTGGEAEVTDDVTLRSLKVNRPRHAQAPTGEKRPSTSSKGGAQGASWSNRYVCIGAGLCDGPGVHIGSETRARLLAEWGPRRGSDGNPILLAEDYYRVEHPWGSGHAATARERAGTYLFGAAAVAGATVLATEAAVAAEGWLARLVLTPPKLLGAGAAAGGAAAASGGTGDLAARAEQVHDALDPIAQNQRTTAVLQTSGGTIVAGGVRDLTPAQRALLGPGEIAAKLPGAHAEVTAIQAAQQAGLTPEAMAVTRVICPQCAAAIEAIGGALTSPTTAVWHK
jgi:RHS repeat-associated protein